MQKNVIKFKKKIKRLIRIKKKILHIIKRLLKNNYQHKFHRPINIIKSQYYS